MNEKHDMDKLPREGMPALLQDICERIVWTTKDGKTFDRLEDAMAHQRRRQIIAAIYEHDSENADWPARAAHEIADHAEELFFLLEPFFRDELAARRAAEDRARFPGCPRCNGDHDEAVCQFAIADRVAQDRRDIFETRAICKNCGEQFTMSSGHKCSGMRAK